MHPAIIYLLKVNNRNGRKKCETCSELTIKTAERRHRRLLFLLLTVNTFIPFLKKFPLFTLNKFMLAGKVR